MQRMLTGLESVDVPALVRLGGHHRGPVDDHDGGVHRPVHVAVHLDDAGVLEGQLLPGPLSYRPKSNGLLGESLYTL